MKTIYLVIVFCLFSCILSAQYKKLPLDTNHYWQQYQGHVGNYPSDFSHCAFILKVKKDSLINGKIFKYVAGSEWQCTPYGTGSSFNLIREDTVKKIVTMIVSQQEKILFNFNKNQGDTAQMLTDSGMATYTLVVKDSLMLSDGFYHKRFYYNAPNVTSARIIEGVGSYGGLCRSWTNSFESYYGLLCLAQINPPVSIYSSEGAGKTCPNITGIPTYMNQKRDILVYPNPGSDILKITSKNTELTSVELIDILGESLMIFPEVHSDVLNINISTLPSGTYILIIKSGNELTTRQLFKD
jgi:hypothetical protein